jgi:hypothetical protein
MYTSQNHHFRHSVTSRPRRGGTEQLKAGDSSQKSEPCPKKHNPVVKLATNAIGKGRKFDTKFTRQKALDNPSHNNHNVASSSIAGTAGNVRNVVDMGSSVASSTPGIEQSRYTNADPLFTNVTVARFEAQSGTSNESPRIRDINAAQPRQSCNNADPLFVNIVARLQSQSGTISENFWLRDIPGDQPRHKNGTKPSSDNRSLLELAEEYKQLLIYSNLSMQRGHWLVSAHLFDSAAKLASLLPSQVVTMCRYEAAFGVRGDGRRFVTSKKASLACSMVDTGTETSQDFLNILRLAILSSDPAEQRKAWKKIKYIKEGRKEVMTVASGFQSRHEESIAFEKAGLRECFSAIGKFCLVGCDCSQQHLHTPNISIPRIYEHPWRDG